MIAREVVENFLTDSGGTTERWEDLQVVVYSEEQIAAICRACGWDKDGINGSSLRTRRRPPFTSPKAIAMRRSLGEGI